MTSVIISPAWPKTPGIISATSVIKKRAQHSSSLASAIAFCAKGSLSHKNRLFGEDFASVKTVVASGPRQNCSLLGVADGVGGWTRYNIDPSRLSKGMLQTMSAKFDEETTDAFESLNYPRELATNAFNVLRENRAYYGGGTTLCFALFDPRTSMLRVSNIGDSAAILIRKGKIAHQTAMGADGMVPHQLTVLPPYMFASAGNFEEDSALKQNLDIEDWKLEPQDVLIIASDGLFDNLPADDIVSVVQEAKFKPDLDSHGLADFIANQLVSEAFRNSRNPHFPSPFAQKYAKLHGSNAYQGGKPDDITVVVSVLNSTEDARAHL